MVKPKIALYWCSSCGGCEESVLDLAERLLSLLDAVDIVFWPVAFDWKTADIEKMRDGELDAVFVNGAVRTADQLDMVRLLRSKARLLFAHGACAHLGGVYGLANFFSAESILRRSFQEIRVIEGPSDPRQKQSEAPQQGAGCELPRFFDRVRPLDQVVPVDYFIPGCPPPSKLVWKAVKGLLKGDLPKKGTVLAERQALCRFCGRKASMPERFAFDRFKRLHETTPDPDICFLAQGLVCLGPSTRGGCDSRCIYANMPCRGCFGPVGDVRDQGAESLAFLASLSDRKDPDEIETLAESLPDPGGLFYRYSLPSSTCKGKAK